MKVKRIIEIEESDFEIIKGLDKTTCSSVVDAAYEAIKQSKPYEEPRDNFDLGYVKGLEDGRNEKPKVISDHFVSYTRTCHICGYSLATYNPEDYKFCPRCGMEF